jgi:hypothetical protein
MTPPDRLVEVCVFKHKEWRFAAGLESYVLQRSAGLFHHFLAHRRAAGESDLVNIGVLRDGGACDLALAVDDVDHSGREAGVSDKIGEVQNRERRLLCWLEDDCVAARQRWAESAIASCQPDSSRSQRVAFHAAPALLPSRHAQRIIPRDNLPTDSHRLSHSVSQLGRARVNDLSMSLVRPSSVVL